MIAFNFKSCSFAPKNVVEKFKNWAMAYFIIDTDSGDSIKATGKHLSWIENEQKWQIARKLNIGDVLKTQNGFASITDVTCIDDVEVDTFNLKIQDCHNYLVGTNGILVHNQSKPSKFEIQKPQQTYFYKITGPDGTYVGQTTRTISERFAEHGIEKGWTPENGWRVEELGKPKNLTPYEASVWEQHYMEQNGGKNNLLNKRNEITEVKYNKYASMHKPCG